MVIPSSVLGPILSTDHRRLRIAPTNGTDPIPDYAILTRKRSANSDPQRTIAQLDHRGRLLRQWDPQQVHALGLATTSSWGDAQFQLLQNHLDLSTEYTRESTERDDSGQITGNDWGEILQIAAPDPDKILIGGVLQSNGPAVRQVASYAYVNNNPVFAQYPEQTDGAWSWNDTFDIVTLAIDETGNRFIQDVDSGTGLITRQRWEHPGPVWQNDIIPTDVNNDGITMPLDALLILNYIGAHGNAIPPGPQHEPPFYDVNGDGLIAPLDALLVNNYLGNPNSSSIIPVKQVLREIHTAYLVAAGLPAGLIHQQTIVTGRASGDTVITYTYYNTPNDIARHARIASITEVDSSNGGNDAVTSFDYDDRGNLSQITDPVGRVTKHFYDRRDRLVATLAPDPDGAGALLPVLVRYDYDVFDNVIATEVINSYIEGTQLVVTALTSSATFDNGNRLTAEISQSPDVQWYLYRDSLGNVVRTQNKATALAASPLNTANLENYAAGNTPIPDAPVTSTALQGLVTSYTYFATPNVISATESNAGLDPRVTHTTFDRLDRVSKVVTPNPVTGLTTTTGDQREAGGFVTSMEYDNLGNLLAVTDGLGNTTSFSYDALNRIVKESLPSPSGSGPTTDTLYAYTATPEGWMISTTDAAGSTVDVQTDSLGRVVSISGDTPTQRFLYWTDGLLYAQIDELNRRTERNYDQRGRLISVTQPTPSSSIATEPASVTTYQYTVDSLLSSVTDPLGRVTSFTHDAGGRVTRVIEPDPDGGGSAAAGYTDYVLDALGNTLAHADALGNTHSVTLDAWFRVLTQSDPDGGVTAVDYDVFGNTLSITDPLGNVTGYSYNKLNQRVTESKGSADRTFSYDGAGNLRSAVDRNGRLTQWSYDNLYRMTSETWRQTASPTSTVLRTFNYDFDAVGRLTEVADSDSLAPDFGFVYDARGQLQLESQQHGLLGQSILFDRNYDAVGNQTLLEANIGGTIAGGAIVGGVFDFRNSYSYDRMDRLTSITQTGRAGSHSVAPKHATFTYDAASQLTDLKRYASTSASSLQVHSRFGRDGAGRLTNITHGGTTIAAGQQWDGSATPPASLGSSELLAGYTFAYDQANRLTELRSWADGTQTAYGYDDRSQLVSAATTAIAGMTPPFGLPGGEGYDFDAGGNRKSGTGASQSATGTHNQLQTDGTYNYFYDGEGNLIRRESISNLTATLYEWDHRNRLVAVKVAPYYQAGPLYQNLFSHRIEYIYDAFDQRVGKQVEDTGAPIGFWGVEWKRYEAYVWADGQEVLRFTDSDGLGTTESFHLASRYLWSDQVDQLLAEEQFAGDTGPSVHATTAHSTTGETLWPLTDHLGSVRGLVDNNGIIRQHVTYDSFGNRLVEQHYDTAGAPVAASHAEAVDTLFGYTGRDWDTDTNLQYNRARWYDPSTGRWLSQDPIGFKAGDANLYRYVGNGATGKTDPSGLVPNQRSAISLSQMLGVIRRMERENPTMSPQQILELWQNRTCWEFGRQIPLGVQLGLIDSDAPVNPLGWAYVYTEDEGWIDLGHFLTTARAAARYRNAGSMIEFMAQLYEDYTEEVGRIDPSRPGMGSSANTPEDPISNRLGIEFGASLADDVLLSVQVERLFRSLNVKDPTDAWNYRMLPSNEVTWETCWQNYPEKAMKRAWIILDRNHPFWKNFPINSPAVQAGINANQIWPPLFTPPSPVPDR